MSKQANARQRRATEAMKRHQQRRILYGVFGLAGLLAAVAIVLLVTGGGEKNQTASSQQPSAAPATWSAEVYTGGARLAVDKTSVDEGSVAYGHEVQARFRLRNVGDQPMTLGTAEVKTLEGCWPPQPVVGQTTLQPGEETTLDVAFSMHEGMGGPHTFEIIVPSNDAVQPSTSLIVAAEYPKP